MNNMTKGMLNNLYAANAQTKTGFDGVATALKMMEGSDDEEKAYSAISHKYTEIVRLLNEIQKELKPFI